MALFAIAGCRRASSETYYDVPPDDAFARLVNADITGFRDARQCGMLVYFTPNRDETNRTITWTVSTGSTTLMRFGVQVVPKDKGSDIEYHIPKGPDGREIYDGAGQYTHPAILQPLRPALRELVDAAMDQRPYDWHKITELGPDYTICSSMRQNFQASGRPYSIDDPSGMTHEQAEAARAQGTSLQVEHDQVFAGSGL